MQAKLRREYDDLIPDLLERYPNRFSKEVRERITRVLILIVMKTPLAFYHPNKFYIVNEHVVQVALHNSCFV